MFVGGREGPVLLKRRLLIQNLVTPRGSGGRPHKGMAETSHSNPRSLLRTLPDNIN